MGRYDRAHEKLLGALEIMATGKGSRPQRLARAGKHCLMGICNQRSNRLPKETAQTLRNLVDELTSVPPPTQWENSFDATAQRMSWQRAERLSEQLFSLFLTVVELRRQAA